MTQEQISAAESGFFLITVSLWLYFSMHPLFSHAHIYTGCIFVGHTTNALCARSLSLSVQSRQKEQRFLDYLWQEAQGDEGKARSSCSCGSLLLEYKCKRAECSTAPTCPNGTFNLAARSSVTFALIFARTAIHELQLRCVENGKCFNKEVSVSKE